MNVRRRGDRGQAVIEMALTLPLLLLVVFGIFDFGFMFQRYEVVTNAAREGARLAVLPDYQDANGVSQAEQRAIDYMTASGLVATGAPIKGACDVAESPGQMCAAVLTAGAFGTGSIPDPDGGPPRTVKQVTVVTQFDHEHIFVGPIVSLFGGSLGTVRLRAVSVMRVE
jgi:Flp pilus assembly protein TadG